MGPNLKLKIHEVDEQNDFLEIDFIGEFDKAGHAEIKNELNNVIKDLVVNNLVFDFENLKFINSEGIGFLMELHTHLVKSGKKLVLVSLRSNVEDIFTTIGLTGIIPVFKNIDSYLNA